MKDPRVKSVGPHYQCKRAFADGWSVEERPSDSEDWTPLESGVFIPSWQYRIVPDAEGWLPHYAHEGAVCPVEKGAVIETNARDYVLPGSSWNWASGKITLYRVIKEAEKPESSDFESWVTRTLDDIDPSWREEVGMTTPHCAVAAIRRLADKRGYVPVEKLPSVKDVSPLAELNRLHFELEALRKEYGK